MQAPAFWWRAPGLISAALAPLHSDVAEAFA